MTLNLDKKFKDIPGYEGIYQVSSCGEFRTLRYRGEKLLKKPKLITPYLKGKRSRCVVNLTDSSGRRKQVPVLRCVVGAWLGGVPDGMVAFHKNGSKFDNALTNIGFATPRELGCLSGSDSRRMPIAKIRADGSVVEHYKSAREAGRRNYISYQCVLNRCYGKVKKPFKLDGYSYKFDK